MTASPSAAVTLGRSKMAARTAAVLLTVAMAGMLLLLCPAALAMSAATPQQQRHLSGLLSSVGQQAAFHVNDKIHFVFTKAKGFHGPLFPPHPSVRPPVRPSVSVCPSFRWRPVNRQSQL